MPASVRPSKKQVTSERRSESPTPYKRSSDATTSTSASESSKERQHSLAERSLVDRARVFDKTYVKSPHQASKANHLQHLLDESNHRKEAMVIHGRRNTYRDANNRGLDGMIEQISSKDAAELQALLDASQHRKKANVTDGVKMVYRPPASQGSKSKAFSIIPQGSARPQAKPLGSDIQALLDASEHKKLLATSSAHRLANRMMQGSQHSRAPAFTFNLRKVKNRIKPALPKGTAPLKPTETTFQNVQAPRLKIDVKTYQVPKFEKTSAQQDLIRTAMISNTYVLKPHAGGANGGNAAPLTAQTLVDAMEPLELRRGQIVHRQGETREEDDNLYVVEEGHVEIKVDGKVVERIHAGGTFGQERLLLRKENNATIQAGTAVTKLFRLGQSTFRAVLQQQYQSVLEELKSKTPKSMASNTWNDNIYNYTSTRVKRVEEEEEEESSDEESVDDDMASRDASIDDDLASFQEESVYTLEDRSSVMVASTKASVKSSSTPTSASFKTQESKQKKKSEKAAPVFNFEDSAIFQQQESLRRSAQKYAATKDDLEFIKVLGEGQFGEVWLVAATLPDQNPKRQEFALKIQKMGDGEDEDNEDGFSTEESKDAIRNEIKALKQLHHPFIVNLVHTYESPDSMDMLLGLIPGGELWEEIHKEDADGNWTSGIAEGRARFYAYVVADTLGFLHSRGFLFRDLKPENIMIDGDGYPIIVDFGFAKYVEQGEKTFTFCGTPNYVAPEIISSIGHSKEVDYWALGVVIYEMVSGENPFFYDGMEQFALYQAITEEDPYEMSADVTASDQVRELTDLLFLKDPKERLGSQGLHEILEHAWFQGMPPMSDIHAKRVDPKVVSELIFEELESVADDETFADIDGLNDKEDEPSSPVRFELPDNFGKRNKNKRSNSFEDPKSLRPESGPRRLSDHDVRLYDDDDEQDESKDAAAMTSPTPQAYIPETPATIKYWTPRKKGLGYYAKMRSPEEKRSSESRRGVVSDFLSSYLEDLGLEDDGGEDYVTKTLTKSEKKNNTFNSSCPGLRY